MYSAQGQNQLQSRRFLANLLCWMTFLPASWMMAQSTQQPPPRPSPSPRKLPPTFRPDDPYEVSAVVTGLQGNGLGNDFGIRGRFTYTYSEHDDSEIGTVSALEAEINWLPVNKAPDVFHGGRALLALAGITESVGDTSERIGIKLGTGFVRSSNAVTRLSQATDGSLTPARFGATTNPVLDLGVLVEAYPRNHHWGFRVDVGDLLAFYPDLPARGFRVRHQLAASIALNYHFLSKSKRKQH